MNEMETEVTRASGTPETVRFSGRWLVVVVFVFASVMGGTLWVYTYYHTRPFRELTAALVEAYPDSMPRVEGGQHKMHKGTPKTLRIVMNAGFDPDSDEEGVAKMTRRVLELTRQHADLSQFEVIHLWLYFDDPQEGMLKKQHVFRAEEVRFRKAES
jgi:hypothetical protein